MQKALTKFAESGQIVEKTNGKQKFYYIKQEDASAANQAELDTLDQACDAARNRTADSVQKLEETKAQAAALSKEVETLTASAHSVGLRRIHRSQRARASAAR